MKGTLHEDQCTFIIACFSFLLTKRNISKLLKISKYIYIEKLSFLNRALYKIICSVLYCRKGHRRQYYTRIFHAWCLRL
jgi:hypothetical protein